MSTGDNVYPPTFIGNTFGPAPEDCPKWGERRLATLEHMMSEIEKGGPCFDGPTYMPGDARVVYVGWLPAGDYGAAGFKAVLEFPQGPPDLPVSVVWNGKPFRLVPSE